MTGTDEAESAKRGIATHYFMQFCNLERFVGEGSEAELRRLVEEQYISSEDGSRVRIRELEKFRNSSLIRKMLGAKRLYRELRFNVRLPAKYFTEDEEKRAVYADKTVLVQGVIDCIIEDADGDLHLIDYKTDRLTREERANRHLGEERLKKAHTLQLSYYALAIREMFGKLPKTIGVYSLHLGDEIRIDNCFAD
jgi:ATP-dependent helicase/nuclease subunit A